MRTANRCCRRRSRLGFRSRPRLHWAGAGTSATPAAASPSSTLAHPPTTRRSTASSTSQRKLPSPPPTSRSPRHRTRKEEATEMTKTTSPTAELSALGVSIWLDDLSRERIASGGLQKLIDDRNVVGVTTNPTIFAAALAKGDAYDAEVSRLASAGTSVTDAVFEITTKDVSDACRMFAS